MERKHMCRIIYLAALLLWVYTIHYADAASCKDRGDCKKSFSETNLKKNLSPLTYQVTQQGGTEEPDTGRYVSLNKAGNYNCGVCGKGVFSSKDKIASKRGYATFKKAEQGAVDFTQRSVKGVVQEEADCGDCGARLGVKKQDGTIDVFSAAVNFKEIKKQAKKTKPSP